MTLMKWRHMRDLSTIQDEINRMFDDCVVNHDRETGMAKIYPASDIVESKDSFEISIELPGLKKEDVKVTLQNNMLTISGEKKVESESREHTFHRVERTYGSFYRSFELPMPVDPGKIQADFKDGILKIGLPKVEEAKPKEIAISVK
jgi:HSP20 family protein